MVNVQEEDLFKETIRLGLIGLFRAEKLSLPSTITIHDVLFLEEKENNSKTPLMEWSSFRI